MKKYIGLALGAIAITLLVSAGQGDKQQNTAGGSTLKVMSHYTGAGTVDDSHKIYIALWDTPDFAQAGANMPPIDVRPVSSKNGLATFTDVKASPVYVSAAYDPKGAWEGHSAPPSGSSLGLYSKDPGKPAPIDVKSGQPATVHLSFDDSHKMP